MSDPHEQSAIPVLAPISTPNTTSNSFFPFLALPFELRLLTYTATLTTSISLTSPSLPSAPTLSSVHHHLFTLGTWNICLCSHQLFIESAPLRWGCLTLVLLPRSPTTTTSPEDDGRARLGAAEQPLRRRIRHLLISDRKCFGLCYGIHYCFHLLSVIVRVEVLDGLFLIQALMPRRPVGAIHRPRGRRLGLEIEVVGTQPGGGQAGMLMNSGVPGLAQESWRRKWVGRQDRFQFVFLNDLIPSLPRGCRVVLLARVTEVTIKVLRELKGFSFTARGEGKWLMTYDEDV